MQKFLILMVFILLRKSLVFVIVSGLEYHSFSLQERESSLEAATAGVLFLCHPRDDHDTPTLLS